MIVLIIILAVIGLALLQKNWAPATLKRLKFRGWSDRTLAEPGQEITWFSQVENHSRLPVPFARLRLDLPLQANIHGSEKWLYAHCSESIQRRLVEEKMTLMPRQKCIRSVRFSLPDRGTYSVGRYWLSAGDLLGLSESGKGGDGQTVVVMPERTRDPGALLALGGFLGEISVRRFILEDPILTVGFRDYTGREPMKSISWTRTAMTGSLQVRQFDHTAEQNIMVILNVESGDHADLEECFRLTRTVCEQLERKKVPYAFRTNGNLPGPVGKVFSLAEGLGSSHLSTILYGLGQADYTRFQAFRNLIKNTLKHRKSNESYIIITPPLDGEGQAAVQALKDAAGCQICLLTAKAEEETP